MAKTNSKSFTYQFRAFIGWLLIILGTGGAIVLLVAKGEPSRYMFAALCLFALAVFGIWLVRTVEKNIFKALGNVIAYFIPF